MPFGIDIRNKKSGVRPLFARTSKVGNIITCHGRIRKELRVNVSLEVAGYNGWMLDFVDKRPFDIPIVVIDTETTGLLPEMGHRVVEIGAVRYENGAEVAQFNSLLYPERKMDADASRVNGIADADLAGQPVFADIAPDLLALLNGALLVAHNAAFDAGFIGMELFISQISGRLAPISLPNPWLCTLELARAYFAFGRNNLGSLAQRLGVPMAQAHRALSDVYTTVEIFKRMVKELNRQNVRTIDDLLFAQGGEIYTPDPPRFVLPEQIEQALANGRDLTIQYRSKSGTTTRTITPKYPTRFRNATYLVAYCHSRQDQRTFRLDRIQKIHEP